MSPHQTHAATVDMFYRTFPGDSYTLSFEPSDEQAAQMTALAGRYAADDGELELFLQALGVLPYESAVNPNGRDAWTKKPARTAKREAALAVNTVECPNGHNRNTHSTYDRAGRYYCQQCRTDTGQRRAQQARERKETAA